MVTSPVFSFTQGIIQFFGNRYRHLFARLELFHPDATVPHVDILPLKKNTVLQALTSVYPDGVDDADFIFVPHLVLGVIVRKNLQYPVFLFLRESLTMHDLPLFLSLPSP